MQFIAYLSQRLNGNFGVSLMSQQDIWIELMTFLPASLELMICALFIALLVGVPLGIFSALTDFALTEFAPFFLHALNSPLLNSPLLHSPPFSART